MDFLGLVFILIGAYMLDSAYKNRQPIRTVASILQDPKNATGILSQANGNGFVSLATPGFIPASHAGVAPPTGQTNAGVGAVNFARAQIGTMYLYGGTGPRYDCSGLVMKAWQSVGYPIPRTTYEQIASNALETITTPNAAGDLIFPTPGHVQMYTGAGTVVEAPRTGLPVREVPAPSTWFMVRRVLTA